MDSVVPFGVYLNGELLAEHDTEEDADVFYMELRNAKAVHFETLVNQSRTRLSTSGRG